MRENRSRESLDRIRMRIFLPSAIVLAGFISNAIEFTAHGEVRIIVQVPDVDLPEPTAPNAPRSMKAGRARGSSPDPS